MKVSTITESIDGEGFFEERNFYFKEELHVAIGRSGLDLGLIHDLLTKLVCMVRGTYGHFYFRC